MSVGYCQVPPVIAVLNIWVPFPFWTSTVCIASRLASATDLVVGHWARVCCVSYVHPRPEDDESSRAVKVTMLRMPTLRTDFLMISPAYPPYLSLFIPSVAFSHGYARSFLLFSLPTMIRMIILVLFLALFELYPMLADNYHDSQLGPVELPAFYRIFLCQERILII